MQWLFDVIRYFQMRLTESSKLSMISKVFDFMDANKTVPEVLLVSNDGDVVRNGLRENGTSGLAKLGIRFRKSLKR